MIVRTEDFEARPPAWMEDPTVSTELKEELRERGMADSASRVDCLEIVDDCFNCGEKLTTPYIYWHGATGTLSLHAKCAVDLVMGLAQDAHQMEAPNDAPTRQAAARWIESLARNSHST